jgi:N-acetylmuramoyl-L-alanine amidase
MVDLGCSVIVGWGSKMGLWQRRSGWSVRGIVGGFVVVAALLAVCPAVASAQSFTDVKGDEWFAPAVEALAAQGIVYGHYDGSFAPNDPVTRAQLTAFLARALHLQDSNVAPFADVTVQDWCFGAVASMYEAGLVSGTGPATFSPNAPVSRQQAATMVMHSLGYLLEKQPQFGVDFILAPSQAGAWLGGFRDRALISPEHAVIVANAYRLGVIEGATDGWLYPALTLNRAQMAAMLYRALLQPITARDVYPAELPAESAYASQSVGSRGALVGFLESRLTALGFPCGPVDGVYDYRTRDAVMAFEKVERLSRDGAVGAKVWPRIFVAQTPLPRLLASGDRAEVDLSRQVLFMIADNVVTKVVHVSTGKLGTPTGHGAVRHKDLGWTKCSVGWMYSPSYIMPKIAIHGSKSVPPWPASHGCVRTPVWMTDELYEQLVMGFPVDIYY